MLETEENSSETFLGFHGTTFDRYNSIRDNGFNRSKGEWSWLGEGVYFFLFGEERAKHWAREKAEFAARKNRSSDAKPVLITAKISKRNVLNLVDKTENIEILKLAYESIDKNIDQLPLLKSDEYLQLSHEEKEQYRYNYRDFWAIERIVKEIGEPIDSVIAAFTDGNPIGKNSWIFDDTQIVLCVRNTSIVEITNVEFV